MLLLALTVTAVGCQNSFASRSWTPVADSDFDQLLALYDHDLQMEWAEELTKPEYAGRLSCSPTEDLVGDWLVELLQGFDLQPWREAGFDSYKQAFKVTGTDDTAENIIAVLPGKISDEYLLIGAHYDHIGEAEDGSYYPGADDNAVGVATVLELARIFSQSHLTPELNIVFVLFSAEERGLLGSAALAKHLTSQKLHRNVALLNLDVIAGIGGETLTIYDNGFKQNTMWSEQALQAAQAGGMEAAIQKRLIGGVDSMSFSAYNIPAITLVWGDLQAHHPHLHQTTDTYENLDPELVNDVTRAIIRIAWTFAMR